MWPFGIRTVCSEESRQMLIGGDAFHSSLGGVLKLWNELLWRSNSVEVMSVACNIG